MGRRRRFVNRMDRRIRVGGAQPLASLATYLFGERRVSQRHGSWRRVSPLPEAPSTRRRMCARCGWTGARRARWLDRRALRVAAGRNERIRLAGWRAGGRRADARRKDGCQCTSLNACDEKVDRTDD